MAMIDRQLIHFNSYTTFNAKKLSANAENTSYTIGSGTTIIVGEPEVAYDSICFIKDSLQLWTHGKIYSTDSFKAEDIDSELEDIESNIASRVSQMEVDVTKKQDKMLYATSIPSSGLTDNTKYILGEITTLDLTTIPTNNKDGILIYFSASSSGCTLTYSANTNWIGETAPSVTAGKKYIILIADNVCGIKEYSPRTQS